MEKNTQSRKWLLTINNPKDHGFEHTQIHDILDSFKAVKYWCMSDEIGKDGTYHTHLFLYSTSGMLFSTVKKKFPTAHIDYCRGTAQENRDYCRKEGKWKGSTKEETNLPDTFEENGTVPLERQGQRNDLIDLFDLIKAGKSNYDILELNPEYLLHIDKIDKCRQILKEQEYKTVFREVLVTYCYGKTGQGKSRGVMEKYGYGKVFRVTDYRHPFDSYKGEDVVVFEEFRSGFSIEEMNNYLDGYPLELPCRYNNKIACYTKVYINTNISLEEQYRKIQHEYPETWQAFLRRINYVKVYKEDGSTDDYASVKEYLNRDFGFVKLDSGPDRNPFIKKGYEQGKMDL